MVVAEPAVAPSVGCEYSPWTYGGAADGAAGVAVAVAVVAVAVAAVAGAGDGAAAVAEALRAWKFAAGQRPTAENSVAALARTAAACL